jgi:hypothetical protein
LGKGRGWGRGEGRGWGKGRGWGTGRVEGVGKVKCLSPQICCPRAACAAYLLKEEMNFSVKRETWAEFDVQVWDEPTVKGIRRGNCKPVWGLAEPPTGGVRGKHNLNLELKKF